MVKLPIVILALALFAEPQVFDVVSVKPSEPAGRGMSMQTSHGRLAAKGATLGFLIQYAFSLKPFQISGGPNWIDSERYEIEGKAELGDSPQDYEKLRLMVQTMLADRFGLKWHKETKQTPIFELTVAKNGPKLQPAKDSSNSSLSGGGRGGPANMHSLTARNSTMANLAAQLSSGLGRLVVDRTGLEGKFDFKLEYADDTSATGTADPLGPSLFTALQEQLGLKLESGRGAVDIFVIDYAQKPADN